MKKRGTRLDCYDKGRHIDEGDVMLLLCLLLLFDEGRKHV